MYKHFLLLFFFLVMGFGQPKGFAAVKTTDISFYSENFAVQYDSELLFRGDLTPNKYNQYTNESQLETFFHLLEQKNYQVLLTNLEQKKREFQLNDWLFYELMKKSVDVIFAQYSKNHRTVINWFLLAKSGYDVRITYLNNQLYLNAFTEDELFEIPIIREKGRSYANISSIHDGKTKAMNKLYVFQFIPNPRGKNFSFNLHQLPTMQPIVVDKKIEFETRDANFEVKIAFDETLIQLMRNYPFVSESQYLEVPMSPTLRASLIPIIKKITANRSWKEALEILAGMTRTGFAYKTDEEVYGKSKPMIADELFYYKYSDCEDRSALFYSMAKEIFDFPMIAVAFPEHVTIAVATPTPIGNSALVYKNKKYYVCDPTGPIGSFRIGQIPEEYRAQSFEVLSSFR